MTMRDGWSRRTFLKGGVLAGGLVAAPGVLTGCAAIGFGDTLDRIKEEGVLRVGHAGERPYAYEENGLRGAIPALHREIFSRIAGESVELRGVQTLFKDLIEGLNAGTFDVIAAGMFVRSDRCDQAAFSDPVYCARSALLTKKGNPLGLSNYSSVERQGATLAVLGGAVEQDDALAVGVPEGRIELVGGQEEGLKLVADGDVDAFALTSISLRALLTSAREPTGTTPPPAGSPSPAELAEQVELLEPFVPVVDGEEKLGCGAAVFRKPDESLREAFNTELATLRSEGTVLELTTPYGFTEAEMAPPEVTTEQLCRTGGASGGQIDPLPR